VKGGSGAGKSAVNKDKNDRKMLTVSVFVVNHLRPHQKTKAHSASRIGFNLTQIKCPYYSNLIGKFLYLADVSSMGMKGQ
jgi:hypothetical protein